MYSEDAKITDMIEEHLQKKKKKKKKKKIKIRKMEREMVGVERKKGKGLPPPLTVLHLTFGNFPLNLLLALLCLSSTTQRTKKPFV
jgi:hypothetical protein